MLTGKPMPKIEKKCCKTLEKQAFSDRMYVKTLHFLVSNKTEHSLTLPKVKPKKLKVHGLVPAS